ncbi:hypothetical protein WISP_41121 [Willisornis vidua]|uniref:Uncharacterized protein n=1 Tax=Willisornis vidua TaxID=1566151 RepID=A0ABQ9DHJ1_9PASS|nr:hypothetical protein WISP_41121 [Willisornis vidua]
MRFPMKPVVQTVMKQLCPAAHKGPGGSRNPPATLAELYTGKGECPKDDCDPMGSLGWNCGHMERGTGSLVGLVTP